MRRQRGWIAAGFTIICQFFFGLSGFGQSRAIVDYVSDQGHSVQVAPDSTATALIGNVVFHHNGAILTCDSAVLHNSRYIECFDNVIINKDSTYIYGDRADFDGITNIARVYSRIVKTVEGDMTMYSYDEVEFNTLSKIGRYTKGGTFQQKDNRMESLEGTYHSNEREAYFTLDVVMQNEEYLVRTDSLGYNLDTEVATFYRPAQIWNRDGDYLSADLGSYDRANDTYSFTQNSYVLTAEQEIWADSITYLKTAGHVFLFGDVQIHDEAQRAYLFGDHGIYWTEDQQALMTENASSIFYEEEEGRDTVYMRADSMLLYTLKPGIDEQAASEKMLGLIGRGERHDSARVSVQGEFPIDRSEWTPPDSMAIWSDERFGRPDSTAYVPADSLADQQPVDPQGGAPPGGPPEEVHSGEPPGEMPDSMAAAERPVVETTREPEPEPESEPVDPEKTLVEETPEAEVAAEKPLEVLPDSIPQVQEPEVPLARRQLRRQERLERRRQQMRAYLEQTGQLAPKADTLAGADSLALPLDSLASVDSLMLPTDSIAVDSIQRIIRAYRNVKVFRSDLQAIGDSLVAWSVDSTAHLYRKAVLWNGNSQITSEVMHFFSRNEQLLRAEFEVLPLMVERVVDSLRMRDSLFNQVRGDRMVAHFIDNEIRRYDVLENANTYYYAEENRALKGFLVATAKELYFRFDSSALQSIAMVEKVDWKLYPMDKIPAEQPRRMDIFEWKEALRPRTKYDVWDRRLRLSERQANAAIEQPRFEMTRRIEATKQYLTGTGEWRDRNDLIRIDPSYFRNENDEE